MVCMLGGFGYWAMHRSALNQALFDAASRSDPEQVSTLLAQGADPNARVEVAGGSIIQRFMDTLLRRPSSGYYAYPLGQAMVSGVWDADHMKVVQLLLEHHANPDIHTVDGRSAALVAVSDAPKERLLMLFLEHGADPNGVDSTGASLLMYAVNAQKSPCVEALLKYGAKPDVANTQGDTPLMWAAYRGDIKSIALLLSAGADVNRKNKNKQTALMYALVRHGPRKKEGNPIERLVDAGADVNIPDSKGCTPFLYALLLRYPESERMLAKGGDVQRAVPRNASKLQLDIQIKMANSSMSISLGCTCTSGVTPLMIASQSHNVELVRQMLARGADVSAQDADGHTALFYAEEDPKIVGLLKGAGVRR